MSDKFKGIKDSSEDIDLEELKSIELELDKLKESQPGIFEYLERVKVKKMKNDYLYYLKVI
ncbi:hypothetical protein COF61_31420 [Bacillus toyonensis]|uniref:hypothetical protein n=1 Tax=Bacillus toyonensis TaxID=155322 RepID=UPI000BFD6E8B|nr:hypothetical protein [Bacillus toyonensis]PHD54392.1 hypothetical protein COF61_31420 [Bacillus toyonensis]